MAPAPGGKLHLWSSSSLKPYTRANGIRRRTIWRGAKSGFLQTGLPLEGVASYLRFAGHCSDRSLMQFVWQGQRYDPMGQKLGEG